MNQDVYFLGSHSKPSLLLFESLTIYIHLEALVYTMECNLPGFAPSAQDLEFWLFGLFNHFFLLKYKLMWFSSCLVPATDLSN